MDSIRVRLRYAIVSQTIALLIVAVLIHWDLLFNTGGCVNWGNYELPCTRTQYEAWLPILVSWQPYSYMGAALPIPFITLAGQVTTWLPLAGLSLLLGPSAGAKIFALLSVVFLGLTFIQFSKGFIDGYWGRLAAAILLIAGPFQLGLYGNGDYSQFVAQGFVFLSIFFLWLAIGQTQRRWIWYPFAFGSLILSVSIIQIFELGLVLFAFSFLAFTILGNRWKREVLLSTARLASRFLLLPALLAPLWLPIVLAPSIALGPSSAYALSISTFQSSSASPLALFFGSAYRWSSGSNLTNNVAFAMTASAGGSAVALLWFGLVLSLVVATWIGVVLLGNRKGYGLLALVLVCSYLGAGSQGALGGFNSYLYLHLYGYQELYASYLWDWVIIVPATALAAGMVVDRAAVAAATRAGLTATVTSRSPERDDVLRCTRAKPGMLRTVPIAGVCIAAVVALLILPTAAIPYAAGAQYGPVPGQGTVPTGLQTINYPASYNQIPSLLQHLVGANYSGVAVFNPSSAWYLSNSSWVTPNFFVYYPTVRTPDLPGFALPPYSVNFYTYWAYSELYSNSTEYVGQLLALEGIQYLLVFYETQSAVSYPFSNGENVSLLLSFQVGIEPVFENKDFAIYQNSFFSGSAVGLANLSIVSGDYSTLDAMAYGGVSLQNQGLVFPGDFTQAQCGQYLAETSRVYAPTMNALNALGLHCTASSVTDPVDYLSPGQVIWDGWASSYANSGALGQNITDAWPSPLAATFGGSHSVDLPVLPSGCSEPCHLWLPVRLGGQPGGSSLLFSFGPSQWTLDTSSAWDGYNNSMVWVELPFNLTPNRETLRVTSFGSYNAIGSVYVASDSTLTSWLSNLEDSKMVLLFTPGGRVAPLTSSTVVQLAEYCDLASAAALEGNCLALQNYGAEALEFSLPVPSRFSGWLSLLVHPVRSGILTLGSTPGQSVGFQTAASGLNGPAAMDWIRIPVVPGEIGPNGTLPIAVDSGTLDVSEIALTPTQFFPEESPHLPNFGFTFSGEDLTADVSHVTWSVENDRGATTLEGTLSLSSAKPGEYLGSLRFSEPTMGETGVGLTYSIGPGLLVGVDGVEVGGVSPLTVTQFSGATETPSYTKSAPFAAVSFYAANALGPDSNVSFSLSLEPIQFQSVSPTSDLASVSGWTIRSNTLGYSIQGPKNPIVLLRIPFYPNLAATPGTTSLDAALGSVNTVIWNPDNSTEIQVMPRSNTYLAVGLGILVGGIAAWALTEFFWIRYRQKRQRPERPGSPN